MYPEGGDDGGAPAMGGGRRFNLEGLIPLILLVIIGVASLNYFGVIEIPYLPTGSSHIQVLFIGQPSSEEQVVLDNLNFMLNYRVRDAGSFGNAASEELHQYDIVILDQSMVADKSVTVSLGEAIQNYVSKGGKLIVVMNSGVYQSAGFGGYQARDAVGWPANFGKLIPVECVLAADNVPSCADGREITVVGRIYQQDFEHPIMLGIPMAPAANEIPYTLSTLAIQANEGAKTIAYIKAENTQQNFPAIVEKKQLLLGTVIYFNYNPGITPTIFTNTIKYLK